jgi:hypothetical protein
MKSIEIVEQKEEQKVKMTREEILAIIAKDGCYSFLSNYSVSEDFILENKGYFEKNIIFLSPMQLSGKFVIEAIDTGYFSAEDIKELNMQTYSGFSSEFISEYREYINWNRMIMYMSTQLDNFDDYIKIIEDENLWGLISANDLPIDFIRDWKHRLDWTFLSIVKNFTDEEKLEFSDYIVIPDGVSTDEPLASGDLGFLDKMTDDELEDLILRINKSINETLR